MRFLGKTAIAFQNTPLRILIQYVLTYSQSQRFTSTFWSLGLCILGTESFGLFSCTINGEERDQTHRAVFR